MFILITYDVTTTNTAGRRRLRNIAKTCLDFGQRVQNSVFECQLDPTQWTLLKHRLLDIIDPNQDSIRFYFLGRNWQRRLEHHGRNNAIDLDGPLII